MNLSRRSSRHDQSTTKRPRLTNSASIIIAILTFSRPCLAVNDCAAELEAVREAFFKQGPMRVDGTGEQWSLAPSPSWKRAETSEKKFAPPNHFAGILQRDGKPALEIIYTDRLWLRENAGSWHERAERQSEIIYDPRISLMHLAMLPLNLSWACIDVAEGAAKWRQATGRISGPQGALDTRIDWTITWHPQTLRMQNVQTETVITIRETSQTTRARWTDIFSYDHAIKIEPPQ